MASGLGWREGVLLGPVGREGRPFHGLWVFAPPVTIVSLQGLASHLLGRVCTRAHSPGGQGTWVSCTDEGGPIPPVRQGPGTGRMHMTEDVM